ncbi:MAG: transcriptional regulator [Pyrinomonadaceae bacterium]|nr:transcriptional regulator [Acidobacteriota bacterium]MBK7933772.1 transcriptional regulator [Acidobacteriota bacterium]MBP7375712.1 transcriptional regulator [Pyrinomonadaceae bacterium]
MAGGNFQRVNELYQFGGFRLDAAERRLWREDEAVQLVPKQFDLLLFFVVNAGRVTKKNEILDAVWPDTFVEETTLARNVSWLRKLLETDGSGKQLIETVPKVGYRFTPEVTEADQNDLLIVEEQTVRYFRSEETISQTPTPTRRFSPVFAATMIGLVFAVLAVSGYGVYRSVATAPSTKAPDRRSLVAAASHQNVVKIGSIVNLQNRYPNDGSYLDAWGSVWSKPEFRQVPTETMFVSTHIEPNRDSGSGSWQIVSANGKSVGETLVVGDRIHLRNMYPNAGYLDACGWTEHLRAFEKFVDQTGAIFTTRSPNRDNGTGVWIIRSATQAEGSLILEGDSIAIESSYFINDNGKNRVSGFLNVAGKVSDIPSFADHNGSKLVFTKSISYNEPIPDIWTITKSNAFPE